ncbi:MAG: putative 2-dehydropantoate 2-reductase [Okeania sp. SIO2F4]|uniref:putative 2-dehydropantoate 2-reductase n=1 Tax=Okeania sp. SIO2F4 TaxID=2607790 RepID=UPI00142BD5A3|nr:putative 2-dehydropantoate 2-reductase [Okeania sp. SIO2F4]NES07896.1 putative 2-dehydropantoate 2-reductase [Okeania sp. SIO2F4]
MSNNTYAIIGSGALGGFYGAKLQKAGLEVHFLLHNDYQHVLENGLIIKSKDGDFNLPQVNAYNNTNKMPKCDVILIGLKTTENHLLAELLPQLLKENTVVLLLQNGLGAEPKIAKIVGEDRVIGGVCNLASNKVSFGYIHHIDYGLIRIGRYARNYQLAEITNKMREITQDFESAGVRVNLTEDLLLERWKKLVWNIPYNSLSVILDARTDEMMGDANTKNLVIEIMREVLEGAKSCERQIPNSYIQEMLDHTDKLPPYLTSMKIDYERRRPLEIEGIIDNPLRMASEVGVKLPKIGMLYQQLKFLDARNRQNFSIQRKIK